MPELNPPEGPFVLTGAATDVEASKLRHSSASFRRMLAAATRSLGGVSQQGDLKVTATGTDVNISIATGDALTLGTQASDQGMYHGRNSGTKVIALLTANPAHATLERIDLCVARFNDSFYSGALDTFSIEMVTGTPAGSPSPPAAPANSMILAQILIPHATTVVNPANITDKRVLTGGRAHLCRVRNSANQAALVASTWTKMILQNVDFDPPGQWSLANNRFIAQVAGYYWIAGAASFVPTAVVNRVIVSYYINGVELLTGRSDTNFTHPAGGIAYSQNAIPQLVFLNAGDYVELWVWSSTAWVPMGWANANGAVFSADLV